MDELPVEVDRHDRDTVVAVGSRHKGALLLVGVALAVVAAVVAVGASRSPRRPHTTSPTSARAVLTTSASFSSTTAAMVTSTSPPTVTAEPTLAGYRLVLLDGGSSVLTVDLATGGPPTPLRLSGAGVGHHDFNPTSKAFVTEEAPTVVLLGFDDGTRVALRGGSVVDVTSEFVLTADAATGRYSLFGARGEPKGTVDVPHSSTPVVLSGNSVIVTGGGQIYRLPFDRNGVAGRDVSQGPPRSISVGELLAAGGGQIAYVACTTQFDCQVRLRAVTGRPEVTSIAYDPRFIPVGFTPDGSLFVAWSGQGLIAIESKNGRVHTVVPADQVLLGRGAGLGRITSDGRYWVSRNGGSLLYVELPDGQHSGVIELPDPGNVDDVALVPKA